MFNPGFDIKIDIDNMNFDYGETSFGPITEKRKLDDIRKSLSNPGAKGPEIVYSVAMDVGKRRDREDLVQRNLLYGAMIFAKGQVGNEPIRSQGHVHAISASCQASTPEVYEIWSGEAIVYMQEYDKDDPGRCMAVKAKAGDLVIVPPGWAHSTINANPQYEMTFGAWCVRDYGFDYGGVRAHGGLAYFPIIDNGEIVFIKNLQYQAANLIIKEAREYKEFNIKRGIPIYTQYETNHESFEFVYNPKVAEELWLNYTP
ncbi:glucose-6-phosphate isomerase family protein [Propionispora hippei]|uniref:glucose-6-phosphate isomerase n=1 Tax=Propionispora hippei DSM 15287 TaxID=1123003 RepID=A0A1M6LJ46_9FIRM|nr:glucose-6-phosphate isomerase family protein [Propionispora hippei]SHJ71211.1 glucose-6-phosphate isomerase [Propionispora hippei DSM 15287]